VAAAFVDTSALVKRYVLEAGTSWMRALADPASANVLYVLNLSFVELTSAVTRRGRAGAIAPPDAALILTQAAQDFRAGYAVVRLNDSDLARAAALANSHALRAYDAIQLGAALELNAGRLFVGLPPLVFVSADQDLNAAAAAEGLVVEDPNRHP
jgi:predicted nucleic acid-binding protein